MRTEDFSSGFDTLLNSYSRNGAFGDTIPDVRLDEYEKSFYLTSAQETYVLSLYNGKNPDGESFEQTEELRRFLSPLVEEKEISPITTTTGILGMESYSKFFTLPENLWFITYESVTVSDSKCENNAFLGVYPVRQDEYQKLRKNPFRGANEHRALRLDLSDGVIEIISKYNVTKYYVRYLRKLRPIVLTDLDENSINGVSAITECELPESMHQKILEMAVIMALRSKGVNVNNENK